MLQLFKALNDNKKKIREFDPVSIQRIKEGAYLTKLTSEAQVAARKCDFFAGNAFDQEVKKYFEDEAKLLRKSARVLQQYYESITTE